MFAGVLKEMANVYSTDSYGLVPSSHAPDWSPDVTRLSPPRTMTESHRVEDKKFWRSAAHTSAAISNRQTDFILSETLWANEIYIIHSLRKNAGHIVASSAKILHPEVQDVHGNPTTEPFNKESRFSALHKDPHTARQCKSKLAWLSVGVKIKNSDPTIIVRQNEIPYFNAQSIRNSNKMRYIN
jgi:hypothetical protein